MNQDVLTYLCRSYYLKQHPVLQEKLAYKENYWGVDIFRWYFDGIAWSLSHHAPYKRNYG